MTASLLISGTFIMLTAWLLVALLPESAHENRRRLLLFALLLLTLSPVAQWLMKNFGVSIAVHTSGPALGHWMAPLSFPLVKGLALVWVIGMTVSLTRTIWSWMGALSLNKKSLRKLAETSLDSAVLVVFSREVSTACVTPGWPSRVLLPEAASEWDQATLACVLRHEQEHLRRGDVWWMLLVQVVRAVWWFHPLVHQLAVRFLQECEHVCDEAVVRSGVAPEMYARTMLELAVAPGHSVTPTAFLGVSPSGLRLRVDAILRESESGRTQFKVLGWLALAMLAVIAAAVTMMRFDGENSASAKVSIETEAKVRLSANPFPGNE